MKKRLRRSKPKRCDCLRDLCGDNIKGISSKTKSLLLLSSGVYQARNPRSTPAATADPMTPATFGPIACMSR